MVMTMRELIMEGVLEKGEERGRRATQEQMGKFALSLFRRDLTRRGINPRPYEKDFAGIADPRKAIRILLAFNRAKNPAAYLRRRFGH